LLYCKEEFILFPESVDIFVRFIIFELVKIELPFFDKALGKEGDLFLDSSLLYPAKTDPFKYLIRIYFYILN
jgi:hypothetical protein